MEGEGGAWGYSRSRDGWGARDSDVADSNNLQEQKIHQISIWREFPQFQSLPLIAPFGQNLFLLGASLFLV
jgi:hypothetical protein